jgi:protein PET117
MSTKAKLTLAATSLGAIGIIVFVHHGQKVEKAVSHSIF